LTATVAMAELSDGYRGLLQWSELRHERSKRMTPERLGASKS
jgi:hypothetical protein